MTSEDLAGQEPAPVDDASETPKQPPLNIPEEALESSTSEADGKPPETTDESANTDSEDKETDEGKPKPDRKKQSAQQRINELTAKRREAEARAQSAERELQHYREKLAKPEQVDPDDFDAQQRAAFRQELTRDKMTDAERRAADARLERHNARADAFDAKLEPIRDVVPDFDKQFNSLPVSEAAAELLSESDVGGELALWLTKNPQEAHRIASLPDIRQVRELARQEALITAAPKARKVSQTPPPPPKVDAKSSPGRKDPAEMTMAEYSAWYKKRGT